MQQHGAADNVRKIIERKNAHAVNCYAKRDIDSLVTIFAEDAWQMPPNLPPLIGREAIRSFWKQAMEWGQWRFVLTTQNVEADGSIAVERGKYVLTFNAGASAPPGMRSFEDHGNYLVHWRRETDGEWRIVGDAPVSELPLRS